MHPKVVPVTAFGCFFSIAITMPIEQGTMEILISIELNHFFNVISTFCLVPAQFLSIFVGLRYKPPVLAAKVRIHLPFHPQDMCLSLFCLNQFCQPVLIYRFIQIQMVGHSQFTAELQVPYHVWRCDWKRCQHKPTRVNPNQNHHENQCHEKMFPRSCLSSKYL